MIKRSLLTILAVLFICLPVCSMERDTSSSSDPKIEFITSDDKSVFCSRELCELSVFIKNMLDDCDYDCSGTIPLLINKADLALIRPLLKSMQKENIQEIRNILGEKNLQELRNVLVASNYLDIRKTCLGGLDIDLTHTVAQEIAQRLVKKENLQKFSVSKEFLYKHGLNCEELPIDLSKMIAREIVTLKGGFKRYLNGHYVKINGGFQQRMLQGCKIPSSSINVGAQVNSASFDPSGKFFVVACDDKTAKIFDANTYACIGVFKGHRDIVFCAAFSNDGNTIATASYDNTVKLWDVKTGKCKKTFRGHNNNVYSVAFDVDGNRIVTASSDHTVRIWDVITGECLQRIDIYSPFCAEFNKKSDQILVASYENGVIIFEKNNKEDKFIRHRIFRDSSRSVLYASYSPSGEKILATLENGKAKMFDVKTGTCVRDFIGHRSNVWFGVFDKAGAYVLTSSYGGTARIWDEKTGECLQILNGHAGSAFSAVFNNLGDKVVVAFKDKTIRIYDLGQFSSLWGYWRFSLTLEQVLLWVSLDESFKCDIEVNVKENDYLKSILDSIKDVSIRNIVYSQAFKPRNCSIL